MTIKRLPRWSPGDRIRARDLNALSRGIRSVAQAGDADVESQIGTETRSKSDMESGGGADISTFAIASEQADTITATDATVIAKPSHFRGTVGVRVVNGEAQLILPTYLGSGPASKNQVTAFNVGDTVTGIAGVEWLAETDRVWAEDT